MPKQPRCAFPEDDEFFLEKPSRRSAEKGRRNAAKALAAKSIANRGLIEKSIYAANKVAGRRHRARIQEQCGDSLAFGVQYSLNKKSRWLVTPETLFSNAQPDPALTVRVVETVKNARDMKLAKAAYTLEADGSVSLRRARGFLAQTETLCKAVDEKNERRKSRRSLSPVNDETTPKEKPKLEVRYTLTKTHPNVDVLTKGHVFVGNGSSVCRDRRQARVKSLKVEDRDESPAPKVILDRDVPERRPMKEIPIEEFIKKPFPKKSERRARRDSSCDGFELIDPYDLDDF